MVSFAFSVLFVFFFMLTLVLRYWLASRHTRHVLGHREHVPAEFAAKIPLEAHRKAADDQPQRIAFQPFERAAGGLARR